MKILFISIGYMPKQLTSDKQFVRDIIFDLPSDVECAVWTINDWPEMCVVEKRNGRSVPVYGGSRLLHSPKYDRQAVARGDYTYRLHGRHPRARQFLEVFATFFARLNRLSDVIEREGPDIIHLTDNWGPIGWMLRMVAGNRPITSTKYGVAIAIKPFYKTFLRSCYVGIDKVLCFTDICREQLASSGVHPDRLATLRWGVKVPPVSSHDPSVSAAIRQRYGCKEGELLTVVAVQCRKGAGDKVCAVVRTVNELVAAAKDVPLRIVAAFKPDQWLPTYSELEQEGVILESGPSDFLDLLWAADLMFSPTYERFQERTTTPPLTWLEAMVRHTPTITSPGYGVDETITDGKTGVLYTGLAELKEKLSRLTDPDCLREMAHAAREVVIQQHSVPTLAAQHVKVWTDLLAGAAHR